MPEVAVPSPTIVDQAVLELIESRIEARIGRWTLAIIGSAVLVTSSLAAMWFGLQTRVQELETWKRERAVGIDKYNEFRTELEGRLTRIEAGQEAILEGLKELKEKR